MSARHSAGRSSPRRAAGASPATPSNNEFDDDEPPRAGRTDGQDWSAVPASSTSYKDVARTASQTAHSLLVLSPPSAQHNKKKTIPNLSQIFEEVELTQSMLDKGEQKKCSICLEDFEVGTKIIYLPCFHYYHSKCIETWVKESDKCPLCNIEIQIPQWNK